MSVYRPARPPPTTPRSSSPFGMDVPLTPGGLEDGGASAVQGSILRNKLSSAQSELARAKRDLKTANEKLLQTSLKLNEEKVAKVALTNKYGAVVQRVRDIEDRMQHTDAAVNAEKFHAKELQRTVDHLRDHLKQKQEQCETLSTEIARLRESEATERGSPGSPANQHDSFAEDRHAREMDHLRSLMSDSFTRLLEDKEANDARFVVLASELTTTVAEQQQMLHRLQIENDAMRDGLQFLVREVEEDSTALVLTLLRENKEVWAQLHSTRSELARLREVERGRSKLASQATLQEQNDHLHAENQKLEDRLRRMVASLRQHTDKSRDHELSLQNLLHALQAAEAEKTHMASELSAANLTCKEYQQQLHQFDSFKSEITRITTAAQKAESALEAERERFVKAETGWKLAVQQAKADSDRERTKHADSERDWKKRAADAAAEHERALSERARELDRVDAARRAAESDRNSAVQHARDEWASARLAWEAEMAELRGLCDQRDRDLQDLRGAAEKEKLDASAMRLEFGTLTKSVVDLRSENQALHAETKALIEKLKEKSRELDGKRQEALELDADLRHALQESTRHRVAEQERLRKSDEEFRKAKAAAQAATTKLEQAEQRRKALESEVRNLAQQLAAGRSSGRSKEALEKDKELLSTENQRILRQYEDVNDQNARLLSEVARLRDRHAGEQVLHDQIAMYQRQLAALEQQVEEMQELREQLARCEAEADELRGERDAVQLRLDGILDETSSLHRKEAELDHCVEAADQQIRRLEQQMERASLFAFRPAQQSPPSPYDTPTKYY